MERTAYPDGSDLTSADSPPPWSGSDAEVLYRRPPAKNSFPEAPDLPHRPDRPDLGQRPGIPEPRDGRYQDRQAEAWEAFAPSRPAGETGEAGWETSGEISPPLPADGPAYPSTTGPTHASGAGAAHVSASNVAHASASNASASAPNAASDAWPRRDQDDSAEPGPARTSFGVSGGPISPSGLADPPRPIDPTPVRRRSRLASMAVSLFAAVVVLAGAAGGFAYFSESGRALLTSWLGGSTPPASAAAAPVGARTTATFVLAAAAPTVTVRSADLGADLFRVTGATAPAVTGDRIELRVAGDADRVEVQLSTKVAWSLQLTGGSRTQVVDLTGGRVDRLDLSGSSDRTELVLPRPAGTVPIKVTGAIGDLAVTVPAAHPVRAVLDSGAATVTAGARTLRDVEPGSTLTPKNWKAEDRYDLGAASRLGTLTIKNAG